MLSEISQKKLRTIWLHSYVGYKTETRRHRQQYGGHQRERGVRDSKGGQTYGDRRCFDFGWWAHNVIYRSCTIEMYA